MQGRPGHDRAAPSGLLPDCIAVTQEQPPVVSTETDSMSRLLAVSDVTALNNHLAPFLPIFFAFGLTAQNHCMNLKRRIRRASAQRGWDERYETQYLYCQMLRCPTPHRHYACCWEACISEIPPPPTGSCIEQNIFYFCTPGSALAALNPINSGRAPC